MSTPAIQFGVLAIPYQTLDVAGPTDLLASCSQTLFEAINAPASLTSKAINIEYHHIGLSLAPVQHTANHYSVPTTTLADCPKLDYLLIGGPFPQWITDGMAEEWKVFIKSRLPQLKRIFTTCTGGVALASSGVLDGMNATTNHEFLDTAKTMFPAVNWKKEQWVVDGKFWTAGGAFAGMDMFASWALEDFDRDVVSVGFKGLDYFPRDINGEKVVL